MREGFFKNQEKQERPNLSALPEGEAGDKAGNAPERGTNRTAGTAEMSFRWLIRAGMFTRIARMMKVSGCKPTASFDTPDVLTLLSTPKPKPPYAFNGLTLPRILTADVGVKTPSPKDVRTTRFDVSVLATSGRLVDVDIFLIKNTNLLKTKIYCQFFVEKRFELRLEVCDFF